MMAAAPYASPAYCKGCTSNGVLLLMTVLGLMQTANPEHTPLTAAPCGCNNANNVLCKQQQQWQQYGRLCASQGLFSLEHAEREREEASSTTISTIKYDTAVPLPEFLQAVAAKKEPTVVVGIPEVEQAAERWADDGYFTTSVMPEVNRILELPRPWYVQYDSRMFSTSSYSYYRMIVARIY